LLPDDRIVHPNFAPESISTIFYNLLVSLKSTWTTTGKTWDKKY
jgi:hypothetical protein